MRRAAMIMLGLVALGSCTPDTAARPADDAPAIVLPAAESRPQIARSNAIPTMSELLEIGLTVDQAECFIAKIDPDKTGVLTDPELFMVAFTACFGDAVDGP